MVGIHEECTGADKGVCVQEPLQGRLEFDRFQKREDLRRVVIPCLVLLAALERSRLSR